MIIVEFDPVTRELALYLEDGSIPISFPADRVIVKHHGQFGQLIADLRHGDSAEVGIYQVPGEAAIDLEINAVGDRRWHVALQPMR